MRAGGKPQRRDWRRFSSRSNIQNGWRTVLQVLERESQIDSSERIHLEKVMGVFGIRVKPPRGSPSARDLGEEDFSLGLHVPEKEQEI